jgi:hypothetical protein
MRENEPLELNKKPIPGLLTQAKSLTLECAILNLPSVADAIYSLL